MTPTIDERLKSLCRPGTQIIGVMLWIAPGGLIGCLIDEHGQQINGSTLWAHVKTLTEVFDAFDRMRETLEAQETERLER